MKVLYAASELFPFAKTGGLADVAAALPAALMKLGIDVRVALPAYPSALKQAQHLREVARIEAFGKFPETRILSGFAPPSNLPIWLVDCPALYDRPGGPYQDESGHPWEDNAERFALFCHAVAKIAQEIWPADVVHANDWHTGLVPLLMRGENRPGTVFTVHNLAYQGLFPAHVLEALGLPDGSYASMEFHGRVSFLKAGIASADMLTTVSPQYALEILGEEYGCGLSGLLAHRRERLSGIMNGADYSIWDPRKDPFLPRSYGPGRMTGKKAIKTILQERLGLSVGEDLPMLAFLSRLDCQKMPEVVAEALPSLLQDGAQFVASAEGQAEYEAMFRRLAETYPNQVHICHYTEAMAHQILAASDILLHPSRFEPCGLVPIYAMRYGTVPVVRRIGGMVDSITAVTPETLQANQATGFLFDGTTAESLLDATREALSYFGQPIIWRKIQRAGMSQEFSWNASAEAYLELYHNVTIAEDAASEVVMVPTEPAVTALTA